MHSTRYLKKTGGDFIRSVFFPNPRAFQQNLKATLQRFWWLFLFLEKLHGISECQPLTHETQVVHHLCLFAHQAWREGWSRFFCFCYSTMLARWWFSTVFFVFNEKPAKMNPIWRNAYFFKWVGKPTHQLGCNYHQRVVVIVKTVDTQLDLVPYAKSDSWKHPGSL